MSIQPLSEQQKQQLRSALNLARRLPPSDIRRNLLGLFELVEDEHVEEHLLQDVDQPLVIKRDPVAGRDYLCCDFNRDADSFRSPWTNTYSPPLADGNVPSDELRKLEEVLNQVFDNYRDKYFEGGVSSVYCWDQEEGFACCILMKKEGDQVKGRGLLSGCWESIHVIDAKEHAASRCHYKLTTTVMLSLTTPVGETGNVNLSGCLTRRKEQEMVVNDQNPHVVNIGNLIQNMENTMRTAVDEIYFGKTTQVISETRKSDARIVSEHLAHGVMEGIGGASEVGKEAA
eukprot:gnl/Hemi2/5357_TR1850_c0_g1_i1.p1 gnl/Hemi2/5357_TR1850_c0_g1~~gnl/Hemi2/5357_TR1850_c0_g1_i1.p1  ORF type:complete len:287 (+),score=75.46 gnl/Hemi2/5357_TR1850_c0_g1_i1:90-950(+)